MQKCRNWKDLCEIRNLPDKKAILDACYDSHSSAVFG